MTEFSKLLNREQCAAATAGDGPLLVLAAAGTGKTRTLVHRVAYLTEKGVPPDRILLLTFTNRAAREMMDRACQVVGPSVAAVWSGTFHSICARFLRRWGSVLGYKPGFQIIDEDDQKRLVAEIIKDRVENPKDFVRKEIVLKMISDAANGREPLVNVASRWQTKVAGFTPEEIVDIAERYAARKFDLGAMDFDDLLTNGLRLLKEHDNIRTMLQEKFEHVLVDEYQDTNHLQAEFTDIIAAGHRNIMAVGDDFQCIYTWRGAKIDNILDFPKRWEDCRIIKLEQNYRSEPEILDVANSVMDNAPAKFRKVLRTTRESCGTRPRITRIFNSKMQAADMVSVIGAMREAGYRYSDIAVLYRSHFHSMDVEKAIHAAGLPYRLTSGTGFYEKAHIKDVLAYLRLALHPDDELSFMRFITLLPGVGETSARKLWSRLGGRLDCRGSASLDKAGELLPAKARPVWPNIKEALSMVPERIADGTAGLIVVDFMTVFYAAHLKNTFDGEESEDRISDVKELAADLAGEQRPLEDYLADAALMTNLDLHKNDPSLDRLTLSTVHQAKGMEWPVVLVPWLCDGMFPSSKALEEQNLEEERRLFYVAVTRAKDKLFMYAPMVRRTPEGGEFPVDTSMFLKSIPGHLVDIRRVEAAYPAIGARGYGAGYGGGYGSSGSGYGRRGYGSSGAGCGERSSQYSRPQTKWKTTWRR